MMLMDLSCPIDFLRADVVRDGFGRGQVYLSFRNDAPYAAERIIGRVVFYNRAGVETARAPLDARVDGAVPGGEFVVRMVADHFPAFDDASVVVQEVAFPGHPSWEAEPGAIIDCTAPELPPGPERVALVAVAGGDAVCYPQQRPEAWVCVCGRFNKREAAVCRRCGRSARESFAAFTPARVAEAYAILSQKADQEERLSRAIARRQEADQKQKTVKRKRANLRLRRAIAFIVLLAVVFGLYMLVRRGISLIRLPVRPVVATEENVDYLPGN